MFLLLSEVVHIHLEATYYCIAVVLLNGRSCPISKFIGAKVIKALSAVIMRIPKRDIGKSRAGGFVTQNLVPHVGGRIYTHCPTAFLNRRDKFLNIVAVVSSALDRPGATCAGVGLDIKPYRSINVIVR
jgi:hypothetical protein